MQMVAIIMTKSIRSGQVSDRENSEIIFVIEYRPVFKIISEVSRSVVQIKARAVIVWVLTQQAKVVQRFTY